MHIRVTSTVLGHADVGRQRIKFQLRMLQQFFQKLDRTGQIINKMHIIHDPVRQLLGMVLNKQRNLS